MRRWGRQSQADLNYSSWDGDVEDAQRAENKYQIFIQNSYIALEYLNALKIDWTKLNTTRHNYWDFWLLCDRTKQKVKMARRIFTCVCVSYSVRHSTFSKLVLCVCVCVEQRRKTVVGFVCFCFDLERIEEIYVRKSNRIEIDSCKCDGVRHQNALQK